MPTDGCRITFHGAAQEVTGSMHLVEYGGRRILLDCGLVQGKRKEAFEKNRNPAVDPATVDAIILSHAHIDHSGNLPTFYKLGFRGKIYATPATRDLCEVMLRDSARVQVRQVELINRLRREKNQRLFETLYEEADAEGVLTHFHAVPYDKPFDVMGGLRATFRDAGHILGSALTLLEFGANGETRRLLFTGDLGRRNRVILRDPAPVHDFDYLIAESTYGNRSHPAAEDLHAQLVELIETVYKQKSRLIIAAFSVGRTQELIYHLHLLHEADRIPHVPIFLDSPMALRATKVFREHTECYDAEANRFLLDGEQPFSFDSLNYVESTADSKKLNGQHGPFAVISASGMCEGGRILHHLVHAVGEKENIILLTGFQGRYTLGRKLREGASPVNILGRPYDVRAKVETIDALSAHADADEMIEYYKSCNARPKQIFLVHGEEEGTHGLRDRLKGGFLFGWNNVEIPAPGDSFTLE